MAMAITSEDQDRRSWRRTPPRPQAVPGPDGRPPHEVVLLHGEEERLRVIEEELEELEEDIQTANAAAAEAEHAWLAHLSTITLDLSLRPKVKSSEDLRRAYAMAEPDSRGVPGRQLHRDYLATKSVVSTLTLKIKAHGERKSALQTLIAGLRFSTGLTP
jgi:hypothetical protein